MPTVFQGNPAQAQGRLAIVVSRFNESITQRLLDGAMLTLASHAVDSSRIDIAWVPGAWEIPLVADKLAESGEYGAIVCLGAVIRGETTHDVYINRAVSLALSQTSVELGVPVIFGLLTCQTLEQAIHRSGGNVGNKGSDCAMAALEMMALLDMLPPQ